MAENAQAGDSLIIEGRMLERTLALLQARGLGYEEVEAPARGIALGRGENTALHIGRVSAASSDANPDGRR
jgi:hypothetical protein